MRYRFFNDNRFFEKKKNIHIYDTFKQLCEKNKIVYEEILYDENEAQNGRHVYTYISPISGKTIVAKTQNNFEFTFIDFYEKVA
jgi:hypothetical protein